MGFAWQGQHPDNKCKVREGNHSSADRRPVDARKAKAPGAPHRVSWRSVRAVQYLTLQNKWHWIQRTYMDLHKYSKVFPRMDIVSECLSKNAFRIKRNKQHCKWQTPYLSSLKTILIYFVSGSSFHSKLQRFEMTAFKLFLLKSALGETLWNWLLFTKPNCRLFRGNNILFCVYVAFRIKIQIVGTFCPVVFLDYSRGQSSPCTCVMILQSLSADIKQALVGQETSELT